MSAAIDMGGAKASPAVAVAWMQAVTDAGGIYALLADRSLHVRMPARGLIRGGPAIQIANDEALLEAVCDAIERRQCGEVA